jgi:isochorismate pyruvate lyase
MGHETMRNADTNTQCDSLAEVRSTIDAIDRELVALLAKRWQLTMRAVPFKARERHFRDDSRRQQLLDERDGWGVAAGLPPGVTRDLYDFHIDQVEAEQAMALDSASRT